MLQRCNYPKAISFNYYGAKGIKVLWDRFSDFERDMGPTYADGLTIGRIDSSGHYCKENCRWETPAQQNRNYSRNVNLTWNGKTQCVEDWAKELGMSSRALGKRIRDGWSTERALTEPIFKGSIIAFGGESRSITQWAELKNIQVKTLCKRLYDGWTIEKALTTPVKSQIHGNAVYDSGGL